MGEYHIIYIYIIIIIYGGRQGGSAMPRPTNGSDEDDAEDNGVDDDVVGDGKINELRTQSKIILNLLLI